MWACGKWQSSRLTSTLLTTRRNFFSKKMAAKMTQDASGLIQFTPKNPTAAVIFVHGLGDTAYGWADAMGSLSNDLSHIKFILPTAKAQPVTLNMGMRMPSWYDIKSLTKREGDNAEGIEDSRDVILSLIQKEVDAGIPHDRIVLGGFSQGGALSLFTGFQMKKALAGVLVLSGYIPRMNTFSPTSEAMNVPLLMCHGDIDPVVQFNWAKQSKDKLETHGVKNLEFRVYPGMEHSACIEELQDIKRWLSRVLPKEGKTEF